MTDVAATSCEAFDAAAVVRRHFAAMRWTDRPVSVRGEVQAVRVILPEALVSEEDLIRHVERCAVERGFSVLFDAHVGEPPERQV